MKSLLIRLIKKLGDMRRHLLYYRIWPAVYRRAAKKPIDEKKVLLASNSKTLPDNLSCMKRELEARGMHCTEMLIPAGAGSISARVAEFRQNIRFQTRLLRLKKKEMLRFEIYLQASPINLL